MKKKNLIINFLFDKKNNWISKFIKRDIFYIKNLKIRKYYDLKKIKNQNITFVLGYTKKLPNKFLISNKMVLIIHESNLPKGKGFSPIQWQLLKNKKKIKTCLFAATNFLDSGDIIHKDTIIFKGTELYDEIREKQAISSINLINKFLKTYPNIKRNKQTGISTFYRRRTPEDSRININMSIKKQFNKFRIVNNDEWPAFFIYKNQKYILKIFRK